jgi:phosphatidylserine/phosphatidylglycerophosphate/cardiolipin synthase-like enzyme
VLDSLDRRGVEAALRVALAERDRRPATSLDLVWTGPEARVSGARDTAVVVRQLFAGAQRSVLVAGYSFDNGAEILRPLHEAMIGRGVEATLFLNIEGDARSEAEVEPVAARFVEAFLRENWPFGEPFPEVYYDPRTVLADSRASLHAKCLVVDDRYALVGSANFTSRGQTRSIETGVLIDDEGFASGLVEQWCGLINAGLVRRWSTTASDQEPSPGPTCGPPRALR